MFLLWINFARGFLSLTRSIVTDEKTAKGRTNIELREQFILADGVSQSMTAFKPRMSVTASPNSGQSPIPTQGPIIKVIQVIRWQIIEHYVKFIA